MARRYAGSLLPRREKGGPLTVGGVALYNVCGGCRVDRGNGVVSLLSGL